MKEEKEEWGGRKGVYNNAGEREGERENECIKEEEYRTYEMKTTRT